MCEVESFKWNSKSVGIKTTVSVLEFKHRVSFRCVMDPSDVFLKFVLFHYT